MGFQSNFTPIIIVGEEFTCYYFSNLVTISGTNLFGHADSITSVTFGDLEADVVDSTSISNSQIRVRIRPNDVIQNTPVTVVITASTMARVSSSVNDWTYLVPGQVVDVQPNIGQRGTVVTINGEWFIIVSRWCVYT